MAGIGLELRRIYRDKKIFSKQKMYLYAGLYYGGPMILGVFLVVFISVLSFHAGLSKQSRTLLTSIFTYSVILSLFFSNTFATVIGRYIADMVYENRIDKILPTFFSSNLLMLLLGELLYGILLFFSGLSMSQLLLNLILFAELILLWNTVSFITSIKKYNVVLLAYIMALLVAFVLGMILYLFQISNVTSMLFTICVGYGVILFALIRILFKSLPISKDNIASFEFLKWFDKYPLLLLMGASLYFGAFLHVVSTWFSPLGKQIQTIYFNASYYDVPAFFSFLTTIITTVNFSIFIEVDFYAKFKRHYWLYNNQGTIHEIEEAKHDMLLVLKRELKYLGWKQMFATMIFTFVGTQVLQMLSLGFTNLMLGYFRILCISYGVFAIAQSMILVLLYFDDVKGATICSLFYALFNVIAVEVKFFIPPSFYGFDFLIANILFFLLAVIRLENITNRLPYLILGCQPMIAVEHQGIFSKFRALLEKGGLDEEMHK